jgi:replication factor A1
MVVKVTDASGEAFISTFNEEAEKIIGCSADELDSLRSQVTLFTCFLMFGCE